MIYKHISFSIHITYISRGPTAYISNHVQVCVYEAEGRDRKREGKRGKNPTDTNVCHGLKLNNKW